MQICSTGFKNEFSAELDHQVCIQCDSDCLTCESSEVCLKCSEDSYLFQNKCLKSCPKDHHEIKEERRCSRCKAGQFEFNLNETTPVVCKKCNDICLTCSLREDYCTSCKKKLYANLGKCEKRCPEAFFSHNDISECEPCVSKCLECKSKKKCLLCRDGFFLYREQCLDECPEGTFQVWMEKRCEDCHLSCRNCLGPGPRDCKNDCLDSRHFYEEISSNKNYSNDESALGYNKSASGSNQSVQGFNESALIKRGRCDCKVGFFEKQEPNCEGKNKNLLNHN